MNLVDRVQAVLLRPKLAWPAIAAEPATVNSIFMQYVVPLAAIPAVCRAVGLFAFGIPLPIIGGTLHYGAVAALVNGIVSYVITLVGVYVLALVIDALAPSFGAVKSPTQAMKVSAYSYTPTFIAGIFGLVPVLSLLAILGSLYGIYELYLGLISTMGAPRQKAVGYVAASIVIAVIVIVIVSFVLGLATQVFNPQVPLFNTTPRY